MAVAGKGRGRVAGSLAAEGDLVRALAFPRFWTDLIERVFQHALAAMLERSAWVAPVMAQVRRSDDLDQGGWRWRL